MKGLQELLVMAFKLQATDDDLRPCCHKPRHQAKYLRKAMTEAARTWHEQKHALSSTYYVGPPMPYEHCFFFPCRIIMEFGPEESDD